MLKRRLRGGSEGAKRMRRKNETERKEKTLKEELKQNLEKAVRKGDLEELRLGLRRKGGSKGSVF